MTPDEHDIMPLFPFCTPIFLSHTLSLSGILDLNKFLQVYSQTIAGSSLESRYDLELDYARVASLYQVPFRPDHFSDFHSHSVVQPNIKIRTDLLPLPHHPSSLPSTNATNTTWPQTCLRTKGLSAAQMRKTSNTKFIPDCLD